MGVLAALQSFLLVARLAEYLALCEFDLTTCC